MTEPYVTDDSFYRKTFEQAPIGAALIDEKGNWLKANAALCRMLGRPEAELLTSNFLSITHPEDVAGCRAAHSLLMSGIRGEAQLVKRFLKPCGGLLWVQVSASLLKDSDSRTTCLAYFQDITESKLSEQELIETKERLDSFITNTSDAVILFDMDFRIQRVNAAFTRIFGWSAEEVAGKQLPTTPPEMLDQALRHMREVAEGNSVVRTQTQKRHKNGSLVELDITKSPIRDSSGAVVSIAAIGRDISEQKRLWREAKESEEALSRLVENTPDPLFILRERSIVQANEAGARLLGAPSSEQLKGLAVDRFLPEENREQVLESLQKRDRRDVTQGCVLKLLTLEGKEFEAEIVGIPAMLHGEQVLHILVRDITERRATEEWIRMSDKLSMVGQLAAGIAHEIRNPLTAIKGFVQLTQRHAGREDYYAILKSEIERIEAITGELLLLARPNPAKTGLHDVRELLGHVVPLLASESILHHVELSTSFPEEAAWIQADGNQIKQVFLNLIKNAIEAMGRPGEVQVRVYRADGCIRTEVADQGDGIPADLLGKLGQPFYTTKEKGTGLGLMVSYRIIENHGGQVTVSSAVGEGTTFTVSLPEASAPANPLGSGL